MRILTLALLAFGIGSTAQAAGDALVIGNSSYNGVQTLFQAAQIDETAEVMRSKGFDVAEARDANGEAMVSSFREFVSRLDSDGGPVVVMLAGAFLHGSGGTYLLPATDGAALGDADVMIESFPVQHALSVLAKYPGHAFLILGESAVAADFGEFLEAGIGDLDVPAGVTLLHGAEADVARFASGGMMEGGARLLEAAKSAGLTVDGFAPADLVMVKAAAPIAAQAPASTPAKDPLAAPATATEDAAAETPMAEASEPVAEDAAPVEMAEAEATAEAPAQEATAEMAEADAPAASGDEMAAEAEASEEMDEGTGAEAVVAEDAMEDEVPPAETAAGGELPFPERSEVEIAADNAAWRAARIEDSEESYEVYLETLPDGSFANAARQRIKAIQDDPYYDLRRAETFMRLDREARREVQRNLSALGHYRMPVDGIFGEGSRGAIKDWQGQNDQTVSGYLDLNQIGMIEKQAEAAMAEAKAVAEHEKAAAAEAARQRRAAAEAEAERKKQQEAAAAAAAAEAARPRGPSDAQAWSEVERLGSEQAVRRYLQIHPNGARATQARQMLQVIESMRN